jgi:hypothetical protein
MRVLGVSRNWSIIVLPLCCFAVLPLNPKPQHCDTKNNALLLTKLALEEKEAKGWVKYLYW